MSSKSLEQDYFNWKIADNTESPYVHSIIKHVLISYRRINKQKNPDFVLDVGCGTGQYVFEIAKFARKVVGVEPFRSAYLKATARKREFKLGKKVSIFNTKIENYNGKYKFDLVLCLATLEHMKKANASFKKIFRLLRNGGMIYLTVPNKLWPFEYHYDLPFLSWLPLKYANTYVKLMKRGQSFEDSAYAKSYFGIKSFFDKFPCKYQFIVPDPDENFLGLGDISFFYTFIKNTGIWLLSKFPPFWFFSKAFILVIIKNEKQKY